MKHCPNPDCPTVREQGVSAEFRDEVESCTDCGAALAHGPRPEPAEAPSDDLPRIISFDDPPPPLPPPPDLPGGVADLVTLETFPVPALAKMAHSYLASRGVYSRVVYAAGAAKLPGLLGPAELQVHPLDEDNARSILEESRGALDHLADDDSPVDPD